MSASEMPVKVLKLWSVLSIMLALFAAPAVAHAQEGNRAGLVVVHGDGAVTRHCVAFDEESISGYELLTRAGLALSVEAGATGATICSIDGEGCNFPQQSCFCQCQSSPCVYWSYWRMTEEGWLYQNLGAGNAKVRAGDVEGWHWAAGTTRTAEAPPTVAFDALCPVQAVATATIITATVPAPSANSKPPAMAATANLTTANTGAATAAPVAAAESVNAGLTLLLGIVAVPLLALVFFALWRRRGVAP